MTGTADRSALRRWRAGITWYATYPTRRRRHARNEQERARERAELLELLPERGVCAEIGTWRGDFAAEILASRNPSRLYLVDPWEYRSEAEYEQSWYGRKRGGQAEMDGIHDGVADRFRDEIERGQVVIRRARSLDAAGSLEHESLDWVYIDGDHTYEGVKGDLEAYFPLVKPGGFLVGDDYVAGEWWGEGVKRAVEEFVPRCSERRIIGTQFLLKKPA